MATQSTQGSTVLHYLPTEAFRSHRCGGEDLILYHVYDVLRFPEHPDKRVGSQTPYRHKFGISCGDPNTYYIHPQHLIAYENFGRHLDWSNREPTYFISLYDNRNDALREGRNRQNRFFDRRMRGLVRIVAVSARRLDNVGAFYFSTTELRQMLQLTALHNLWTLTNRAEWFVMEYVPHNAVVADLSLLEAQERL